MRQTVFQLHRRLRGHDVLADEPQLRPRLRLHFQQRDGEEPGGDGGGRGNGDFNFALTAAKSTFWMLNTIILTLKIA